MFDSQDRRAALLKLFAGVGAAGVALGEALDGASAVDAEKKGKRKKRTRPRHLWHGKLIDPVYTPLGTGDTTYYTITAQGAGGGTLHDRKRERKVRMTDVRLFHFMETKSGGNFRGEQSFTLQGINWRLLGAAYDKRTITWTLDVRVCESNPDARPVVATGAEAIAADDNSHEATGCSCDCGAHCYWCGSPYNIYCGDSYRAACS